jgi:hypothetical protein
MSGFPISVISPLYTSLIDSFRCDNPILLAVSSSGYPVAAFVMPLTVSIG